MNKKPLTKVAKIIAGQSPPSTTYNHTGDGLPFFQGKADFQERSPRVRTWCNSERRKEALPGDVLISVRAPVGAVNLCDQTSIIGRGLSAIRPTDELHGEYLFHFLRCHERQVASLGTGSTFQAITQDTLGKIEIPLPPLDDQKRIAYLLSKVEGMIAQRKEHLRQLDDLLKSVFLTMFGDPVRNEKGWDTKPLSELLGDIESGKSPKCEARSAGADDWGILKLGAVTECVYKDDENKALPIDVAPHSDCEVKVGDVLFSRKNTYELVAACVYVFETRKKLLLPDLIFRLVIKDGAPLVPIYLWQLLISDSQRRQIQSTASGAAGSMPNISKSNLYKIRVPCPPVELQNELARIVKKVELIKTLLLRNLREQQRLFAVLSQQAFSGQLNLSRLAVPATDEGTLEPETIESMCAVSEDAAFELPKPPDLRQLGTTKGRKISVQAWLDAYAKQVGEQSISTDAFINHAQRKLAELQSTDDAPDYEYVFSAADYDHVKDWIFKNLESKRLNQDYDNANNRVQISFAKD